jgi:hypothetical protein
MYSQLKWHAGYLSRLMPPKEYIDKFHDKGAEQTQQWQALDVLSIRWIDDLTGIYLA